MIFPPSGDEILPSRIESQSILDPPAAEFMIEIGIFQIHKVI